MPEKTLDSPGPFQSAVACLDAQVTATVLLADEDQQAMTRRQGEPGEGIDGRRAPVAGHHKSAVIDIDGKQAPWLGKLGCPLSFCDAEADAVDIVVERRSVVEPQEEEEGRTVTINAQQAEPDLSVVIGRVEKTGTHSHNLLATMLDLHVFLRNRIGWLAEQEVPCQQDDKLCHCSCFLIEKRI